MLCRHYIKLGIKSSYDFQSSLFRAERGCHRVARVSTWPECDKKKWSDRPTDRPTDNEKVIDLSSWGRKEWRIQKIALNSLKIRYVQDRTPKYPRPCTLACNSKIIWVSDSGQVGGFPKKFQSYPLGEAFRKIMLNFNIFQGNLFYEDDPKTFFKVAQNWISCSLASLPYQV